MRKTNELCRLAKHTVWVAGFLFLTACAADARSEASVDGVSGLAAAGEQGPGTPVPSEYFFGKETGEEPPPPPPANPPAESVLDYTWWGQPNGYWCGPASTRMALGTRLKEPPSQQTLATFMGTTTNGTDHIGLVRDALNRWLTPKIPYEPKVMDWRPTQEQRDLLKRDILARLGSGWPIVANVVSGWRPPGYPTGPVYHYVTVVGYADGGEKILIADPAAEGSAGPKWENVPRTYWISLQDLGTWIGGKGYTG